MIHDTFEKRCFFPLFLALFSVCLGCDKRTGPVREFQQFVSSHPQLSAPTGHSFRLVLMQKSSPNVLTLIWGNVDHYNAVFKVARLDEQSETLNDSMPIDYAALSKKLSKLVGVEDCDWINGRNEQYGFGVRKEGEKFRFQGVQESKNEVVTKSALAYAHVYQKCMIKDLELHFRVVGFEEHHSDEFPNSVLVSLNHQTKGFNCEMYLDREQGRCLGLKNFEDGKLFSKSIHRYENRDSLWIPLAEEYYGQDESGEVNLKRVEFFLNWIPDDTLDESRCKLAYYGLPEPEFSRIPNRNWMAWLAGSFAIFSIGFIIYRKVKQR